MDEVAFGRYRLIELIGEGGMGKVYKAHDTVIGREVAIKVLSGDLGGERGYRERFRREAHTVARLTEPHIIPIYDTGEVDGRLYLVMPIINGIDLQSLLERGGPMTPTLAVKVIEQIASALDTAHAHGLVHRDVKPSNALMTPSEFVYLIDFGIARDSTATKLTQTGSVVGTFAYMAPERFTEGNADGRSDVYSLACVLYECLTGQMPYPADSLEQQMAGHLTKAPPAPSAVNPAVPTSFDVVIARGMAKTPEQRYQTASELAAGARRALPDAATVQESQGTAATVAPAAIPPLVASTGTPAQTGSHGEADGASKSSATPAASSDDLGTSVAATSLSAIPAPTEVLSTSRKSGPSAERANRTKIRAALRSPLTPGFVAAVLALAAVAVAFLGLGAAPHGGDLPPGAVTIAGVDPTRSGEVVVDLSKPIPVTVNAADADSVTLTLDILGARVGQHEAALPPGSASRDTTLPPPENRFVLAGHTTAQITLLRDHTPVGTYQFTMTSTQRATTTVAAAATVVLILFAAAYLESNLRVLRRGRESVLARFAVALSAVALGVAAVAAAWILLGHPLTIATLAWSAGLAGAAGIAAAIGASWVGGRSRERRLARAHTQAVAPRLPLQR